MRQLNYRQTLSPAQRNAVDPIVLSSRKATVVSLGKAGIYKDAKFEVDHYRLTVETSEEPGRLFVLQGNASMARPLAAFKIGESLSFSGVVEGSYRNAYITVTELAAYVPGNEQAVEPARFDEPDGF